MALVTASRYRAEMVDHEPPYDAPGTLPGLLQRGRGDGARLAVSLGARDEVMACVTVDYRWDWQVDSRPEYLARLVRDLDIPIEPIVRQLWNSPGPDDWRDVTNLFHLAGSVLETMSLDHDGARSALTHYIRDGDHWIKALEGVTVDWPRQWWEELYPVVTRRLTEADVERLCLFSEPWSVWVRDRPEFAARVARRSAQRERDTARRRSEIPSERLLSTVRDPDAPRRAKTEALHRLARTRVPLEILDLAESMTFQFGPDGDTFVTPGYARAVSSLGAAAVGPARDWVGHVVPGLAWLGLRTLAEHGDRTDLPVLAAAIRQRIDTDDWCGHDTLFEGMIRLGLATDTTTIPARQAIEQLHHLWQSTPHSRERASYLRCLLAFGAADQQAVEGL